MYVIAKPAGTQRPQLYETRRAGTQLLGRAPDATKYGGGTAVRISPDDIIIHLGERPPYGTAYGVLVEPIHDRWLVRGWGTVHCYLPKITDSQRERISKALVTSRRLVERQFPDMVRWELHTDVRNPKGRILATYGYRPKGEDVLTLRPQGEIGARELVKMITHELGHGVWHRGMTAEQRAQWIKLHARYVRVSSVSVADVKRMVRGMRQIASVRDYLKDADPEDVVRAQIYLGWCKKVYSLTGRELQDLVNSGDELPVPDTHLHLSDMNAPITMYSKESPSELFCEALSSHLVNDLSDRHMIRMLDARMRASTDR